MRWAAMVPRRNVDEIDALPASGSVMGTVGYMSPEQVRRQTVDCRFDTFSFSAILCKMVTGKRAFTGDSAIETMNAILKSDVEEIDPSNALGVFLAWRFTERNRPFTRKWSPQGSPNQ